MYDPHAIRTRTIIGTLLSVLALVLFASYILFQSRDLLRGPQVEITTPAHGAALVDRLVMVEGTAENISFLTLNDRRIFVDEEGVFEERLALPAGYTILTVAAEDRFGRVREERIEVFVSPAS